MGTVIQTRIDSAVRKNAESVLKRLGLSMNDAIRIFINQVVEDQGLPFRPSLRSKTPNAETLKAIEDARQGNVSRRFSSVDELMEDLNA